MSEGLRTEDVKEALARYDDGERLRGREWAPVLAAARAWLTSQATTEGRYVEPAGSSEQTLDYEAAARVYWESKTSQGPYEARSEREKDEVIRPVARAIVDAALVGFNRTAGEQSLGLGPNPQPTESPEVPT